MEDIKQYTQENHKYKPSSPIGYLIRIGRENSYVTYDDILHVIPQPELHLTYLELIFATLITAGITINDE